MLALRCLLCLITDSPGRDPNVISTSSLRSQSALGSSDTGHRALVLKVCFSVIFGIRLTVRMIAILH